MHINGAALVKEGSNQKGGTSLSRRGRKALSPFSPYIKAVNDAKKNQWSASNTDGFFLAYSGPCSSSAEYISLRKGVSYCLRVWGHVAVLSMTPLVDVGIDRWRQLKVCCPLTSSMRKIRNCREVPATVGLYSNFRGGERLCHALASMMQRTFMGVEVNPAHICISSGVTAVLDLFFFATCDPGDGCLIPAPYFPAFDNDMAIRNEVTPIPIQPADTRTYIPTAMEMEAAVTEAAKRGIRARILLITNPGNPLGTLYPEATLKELLLWAVNRGLHVLSDEIYANSKFGPSAEQFVSMEKVASNAVSEKLLSADVVAELVHTAYGMSKDFG